MTRGADQPHQTLRSFAGLFVLAWFLNAATVEYAFAGGSFKLNQPVALLVAALATYRYGLLGRRWRPGGSLLALAAILPGGILLALLAGLLGDERVSRSATWVSQVGPLGLALWWLWAWGAELRFARRRAKLCVVLAAVGLAGVGLGSLLSWSWTPEGRWPEDATGFFAAGVPLSLVSWGQAAALVICQLLTLALVMAFFVLLASMEHAAKTFSAETPLDPPEGASWIAPLPTTRRAALLTFLGVGLLGSLALAGSNLVFVPLVQAPTYLLAPVAWVLAGWLARRWFDASSGVWVAKSGIVADNRFREWSTFSSWEASFDRFTLQRAGGAQVIPIEDSDPRRGLVEQWIERDESAPDRVSEPAGQTTDRVPSAPRRPRAAIVLVIVVAALSAPWWWGPVGSVVSPALRRAQLQSWNRKAVAGLRTIAAAQAAFRASNGRFASLDELEQTGLLGPDALPKGIYFGTRTTKANPSVTWWAVAAPLRVAGSFQAFYTNETGKIWELPLQTSPDGRSRTIPTPNDYGDVSTPPPNATLYKDP